jgi:RNA polymerase sigma factor (sigma-70 family)
MALAELTPPELSGENVEPQSMPLHEPELGIDQRMTSLIRQRIVDTSIELPPIRLGRRNDTEAWDWPTVVAYGRFVCDVLGLDPSDPESSPPNYILLDRAARVLDGPSTSTMYGLRSNGISKLHQEIGFRSRIAMFDEWGATDLMTGAQRLVEQNEGKRPSISQIKQASRQGDFPGLEFLYNNIGGLTELHELIGLPSGMGWEALDWLEMAVAIKIQNGTDTVINYPALVELNRKCVLPTPRVMYNTFDIVETLDTLGDEAYQRHVAETHTLEAKQTGMIAQLRKEDEVFEELTDLMQDEELHKVWGGYRLITELVPETDRAQAGELAQTCTASQIADWICAYRSDMKYADVKAWAKLLEVSNTLWPYRFYNADLSLKNPRRKPIAEIPAETVTMPAETDDRQVIRRLNRQRRLARLAASGLELSVHAEEPVIDISRFAKKAGDFTADEMHELQALVRRGQRKAKRLELLGDSLGRVEQAEIRHDIALGEQAKTAFVKANEGLVRFFLHRKFAGTRTEAQLEEILHNGRAGVIKALHKFDPDKGFKFGTYAQWWINLFAFQSARQQNFGLSLSHHDDAFVRSAYHQAERAGHREVDPEAERLRRLGGVTSLDRPMLTPKGGEGADIKYFQPAEGLSPSDLALNHVELQESLEALDESERLVVSLEYCLDYPDFKRQGKRITRNQRSPNEIAQVLEWPVDKVETVLGAAWKKLQAAA